MRESWQRTGRTSRTLDEAGRFALASREMASIGIVDGSITGGDVFNQRNISS